MALDAEMLNVVPREGAWWGYCGCPGRISSVNSSQQTTEQYFYFLLFLIKAKVLFEFLPVCKNRY